MRPGDIYIARRGNKVLPVMIRRSLPAGGADVTHVLTRKPLRLRRGEIRRKAGPWDTAIIASLVEERS